MNYMYKRVMLAVLVVPFAIPGTLFAMEKTVKEKVNTIGSSATRELILQLATLGTKRLFKFDVKKKGITVIDNEIAVDAFENAASNFLAPQGDSAALSAAEGFARGWFRSFVATTLVSYLNKGLSDKVTKSDLYNGASLFIKGFIRFGVDSAVETAKRSVKEGKFGVHTVRVGVGYEFTAAS